MSCGGRFVEAGYERDAPGARLRDFHVKGGVVYVGQGPGSPGFEARGRAGGGGRRFVYVGETGRCAAVRVAEHLRGWAGEVEKREGFRFGWFVWPLSYGLESEVRYACEAGLISEARRLWAKNSPGLVVVNKVSGRVVEGGQVCGRCGRSLDVLDFPDTGSVVCKRCWAERYELEGRVCWWCERRLLPERFGRVCWQCDDGRVRGRVFSVCFGCRHRFPDGSGRRWGCSRGDRPLRCEGRF